MLGLTDSEAMMAIEFGVHSYENAEDMFDDIRRGTEVLDGNVQPWQSALKPGDFAVMLFKSYGDSFVIFYEILPEDPEDTPLSPNARLVMGYSCAEPTGEMGLVHVAQLDRQITQEEFNFWRQHHWNAPVGGS